MPEGQEEYEAYCGAMGWKKQRPWHLLPSDEQLAWRAVASVRGAQYSSGYRAGLDEMCGYTEIECPECGSYFEYEVQAP